MPGRRYGGSPDDAALDAAVLRYAADDAARARFAADADLTGDFRVPVLTAHAIGDPTAFVELEHAFRETVRAAGNAHRLVQTYVDHDEHSHLDDATYPPLFDALLRWVEQRERPAPAGVAQRCRALADAEGWHGGCRHVPDHEPRPLDSRVPPRR